MPSHTILNVHIDDLSDEALRQIILVCLKSETGKVIVTPNAEMLLLSRRDETFRRRLNDADLHLPDSVSLRYAVAALTDDHLQYRHTGVDTLSLIAELCAEHSKRLLLLGGAPGCADRAAKNIRNLVTDALDVHAIDPGVIEWDGAGVVLPAAMEELIRQIEPNVIAVAFGQQKQEAFMDYYRGRFPSVRFMIGVGGAFEMLSGQKKRSPKWMRSLGLEFIWRVLIEPRRAGRIIRASVVFPMVVATEAARQKRFVKAVKRVIPEVARQLLHL